MHLLALVIAVSLPAQVDVDVDAVAPPASVCTDAPKAGPPIRWVDTNLKTSNDPDVAPVVGWSLILGGGGAAVVGALFAVATVGAGAIGFAQHMAYLNYVPPADASPDEISSDLAGLRNGSNVGYAVAMATGATSGAFLVAAPALVGSGGLVLLLDE